MEKKPYPLTQNTETTHLTGPPFTGQGFNTTKLKAHFLELKEFF